MKLDDIDTRNYTAEEFLKLVLERKKPEFEMLEVWLSRAIAYNKLNHVVRVSIADAEREVEKLRRGEA